MINAYPNILVGESRAIWEQAVNDNLIDIVQCDCEKMLPLKEIVTAFCVDYVDSDSISECGIDYLYMDIYATLGHDKDYKTTKYLCGQLKPNECYFWGQEIKFPEIAMDLGIVKIDAENLKDVVKKLNIPLGIDKWSIEKRQLYARMIDAAVFNVMMA